MTILIAFHQSAYRNFKWFYTQLVCRYWRKAFPRLLDGAATSPRNHPSYPMPFYLTLFNPNSRSLQQGLIKAQVRVRWAIAANPNASVHWLEQLAQDPKQKVRHAIARNPNTPVHLLEQLAEDSELGVRHAIAYDPNTPLDPLKSGG